MRFRSLLIALLMVCVGFLTACGEGPAQAYDPTTMTYDDILNTGLANKCPQISEFTRGSVSISVDEPLAMVDLCLEPQEYFVKAEPTSKRQEAKFVQGKLLTRDTSSLEQIRGTVTVDNNGVLTLTEKRRH